MDLEEGKICPRVEGAFSLLAKKWTGLILFALLDGERRFVELRDTIPVLSARLLSLRLKELEEAGLVERRVSLSAPVRVNYRLTDKGREFSSILENVAVWARKYL
jgi:DNA-binding HxlR family transcriptional regulator